MLALKLYKFETFNSKESNYKEGEGEREKEKRNKKYYILTIETHGRTCQKGKNYFFFGSRTLNTNKSSSSRFEAAIEVAFVSILPM